MKPTLTLLFLTAACLSASAQDTICFTRPQYEAMATDLQRSDYTREVVLPSLRYIINNQSDTITSQAIHIMDLERTLRTEPKRTGGFWLVAGGVSIGVTLTLIATLWL